MCPPVGGAEAALLDNIRPWDYPHPMSFSEFISPVSVEQFMADIFGKKPLHVPAGGSVSRQGAISWGRLNELLAVRSQWTPQKLKLIMNSRPISAEHYIEEANTLEGVVRRAAPAKIDVFLAMGASLVANAVEEVAPEVQETASLLGQQFWALVGANAYCSSRSVQAFASHCDLHEVFAVQCEGEKVWNIYKNRAVAPVVALQGEDAQQIIDAAKGPILMQVRMRPGDLLYIPRGFYHDALASSEASLHVTFSVAQLTGLAIFELLAEHAAEEEIFREYLPDARLEGGRLLEQRLSELSAKMAGLLKEKRLAAQLRDRQRGLWQPHCKFRLPERQQLDFFARTDRQAQLSLQNSAPVLVTRGRTFELDDLATAAEWLLSRPAFALQELFATFPRLDRSNLRKLVGHLEAEGVLVRYEPKLGSA